MQLGKGPLGRHDLASHSSLGAQNGIVEDGGTSRVLGLFFFFYFK